MAEYQGPYSGAQVDTALKAALELQPKVSKIDSEVAEHRKTIKSLSETKADKTGYYPQMSVGQADNLPDRGDVVEGLLGFRESAGAGNSIEDGTANVQELLGESLVWNQRVDASKIAKNVVTGNTVTQLGNGYVRAEVAQGVTSGGVTINKIWTGIIEGHKYAVQVDIISSTSLILYALGFRNNNATGSTKFIVEATDSIIYLIVSPSAIAEQSISFDARLLLTDLTQMFGAGNEPTTVEEFEAIKNQLVGVDFTAYNAGEILGVNIKGIKSVNDNAWDEEWELGNIDSNTGELTLSNNTIRPKNYIKVLPNEQYHINTTFSEWVLFYDTDKNFISASWQGSVKVFTTPSNCAYILFRIPQTYGTTYNHDICIRLAHSGYKTDYVAHEESKSSFDLTPYFPDGMHGINGVRDSVTKSKAVRRFGMVKMKDLSWGYSETYNGFIGYTDAFSHTANAIKKEWRGISTRYPYSGGYFNLNDKEIGYIFDFHVLVKDSAYTDLASFKASLTDDDILIYELATPIETEIDPQLNMNYKVWDFGTEELLTDSKSAPVLARTIYGFNATDTIRGNKAKIEDHEERISDLENEVVRVGDYQPDLSVGVADNLAGTDYTESEIGFRRSGGGAILDGAARVSSVKGNSVVWNQIVTTTTDSIEANGVHIISQGDGSIKVYTDDTGATEEVGISSDPVYFLPNHKYAMLGCPQGGGNTTYYMWWTAFAKSDRGGGLIETYSGSGAVSYWAIVVKAGTIIPQTSPLIFRPRAFDLTLMFGAGNEPTTIEEFYARKPKVADENAYNEGEVIHMEADAIKSVGVNQWDEEWRVSRSSLSSKNLTPILPNTTYCFKGVVGSYSDVLFYDSDRLQIPGSTLWLTGVSSAGMQTFTTPANAAFCKFIMSDGYGTTYNNDICINLSDTEVNGKYFPYIKREQSLEIIKKYFPQGMKSAGTAHDEIRWNAQKQKWEAIKRIGEVDMGSLTWDYSPATWGQPILNAPITDRAISRINLLCTKYATEMTSSVADLLDKHITGSPSSNKVFIRDLSFTDAASFKASLQGVILYYELAEPIVTEIDENFNLDYEVWNAGTEQMIADTPSTPVKASIAYGFNAVGKIKQLEEIIAQLQTAIANLSNS